MPDKHLYEFTQDTSPALTDFAVITGASRTDDYKTLLSDLAKVFIETYAGSTLGGSARSVQSAIAYVVDELSQRIALTTGDRTSIPTGSDLDTYTTVGNYKVTSGTIASGIENMPVALAGILWVMTSSDASKWYQIYFANKAGLQIFARTKFNSSGAWSAWNEITYRYTFDSAPTDGSTNPVTSGGVHTAIASVETEVAKKADAEGESPDLVAGSANAILSDSYTEDSVPYTFRRTPYKSRRLSDEIVGGSVVFNQLVQGLRTSSHDGITTSYDSQTGLLTIKNDSRASNYSSGSTRGAIVAQDKCIVDHKYAVITDKKVTGVCVIPKGAQTPTILNFNDAGNSIDLRITYAYDFVSAHPVGDVTSLHLYVVDLTQMFGATIADYLYNLEQSTAGAGVALFRSLFDASYYPYNAGELISIIGLSARKAVGFNQWDEEWETGIINASGAPADSTNTIRSKNFCKILSGTTYYARTSKTDGGNQNVYYLTIVLYDENKNFIRKIASNNNTFTTPDNAAYFKVHTNTSTVIYGNVYLNDICINLSDTAKNGTYEPYDEHTYPLDASLTLRGIPKLDSNNKLYFDGDTYASDGTVTRRYGIVDLGSLTWTYQAAIDSHNKDGFITGAISNNVKPASDINVIGQMLCTNYTNDSYAMVYVADVDIDKVIALRTNGGLRVRDSAYTDAQAFKTSLSGVMLVYELQTTVTETAEPYQEIQICSPDGTEEYVSTGIVPIGHETKYYKDIISAIEGIPDAPNTNGTYVLKCTVSNGVATYSWESAT